MNNNTLIILGAVVVAILALFRLINNNPFVLRREYADFQSSLREDMRELKEEVRSLRAYVERVMTRHDA